MIFAADYPFLDVFWTMVIFFFWVAWIWILVSVLMDVFRRDDLSGWGKAGWTLFVIVLPYLGVFVYLITQGKQMAERTVATRSGYGYGPPAHSAGAAGGGAADQIAKAKQLLDSGAIDQAEFDLIKRKALA